MKKSLAFCLTAVISLSVLAGCSSPVVSSSSAPVSTAPSSSAVVSQPSSSAASAYDVNELLTTVSEAAGLGATLAYTQTDLQFQSPLTEEDIANMAGAKSNLFNDNGGVVIVVEAAEGKADAVKSGLEDFRDGILNASENYKEDFPEAYANLEAAKIVVKDNFVVFAASATGDYDALDAALNTLFA